jgi:hypothetical protein
MKSGSVQVDGVEYRWSVYRQPSWSSEGLVGMAILIELTETGTRELLLDFEMNDPGIHRCTPNQQRFRVSNKKLVQCIQAAIEAGWNPHKRGKRFVFQAGPLNPN